MFSIPLPDLQVAFSERLVQARGLFLQQALFQTVAACDITVLDQEAHLYVPTDALRKLAAHGLRAELLFALPTILRSNPRLLGYYRLVLGYSRKAFYSKNFGLTSTFYTKMEDEGIVHPSIDQYIPELCKSLNTSAAFLLISLPEDCITSDHLDDLSLLTFGPQLRGGHNVSIGANAVKEVFDLIKELVGPHATSVNDRLVSLNDATGREIKILLSSDPDIEFLTVGRGTHRDSPLLAIEVKGGEDRSNVHNRLGEAEKSHLKAKAKGHTDMWTITNVENLSEEDRRAESPTTTAFFDLSDLASRTGDAYEDFIEKLSQKLRLPIG